MTQKESYVTKCTTDLTVLTVQCNDGVKPEWDDCCGLL